MLASLPDFITAYWMHLAGVVVLLAGLSFYSEKLFGYLKKGLLIGFVIFAAVAAYELTTGNSLFSLPGSIDRKLSEDSENIETGRRYYKSYEERFGEQPPEDN